MVQFRGININVVSQFDAKRLPEHSTARAFDDSGTVVACYIPIYAGAQIWLEYSIDGPHPPKAAYFFKMLINGQVVTSWDCTTKHEYHGKTVYLLQTTKLNTHGQLSILQKSMAFGSTDRTRSPDSKKDCIEIRVHRIEYRRRIRELSLDPALPKSRTQEALKIIDHGPIELYRPARRYQYQLLDPQDEPYATFRFYYRSQEYLERHQIIDVDRSLSSTSLATSASDRFHTPTSTSPKKGEQTAEQAQEQSAIRDRPSTPSRLPVHIHELSAEKLSPITLKHSRSRSPVKTRSPVGHEKTISLKDSIEDLASTVPRSPQSPRRIAFPSQSKEQEEEILPSPTRCSSPLLPEALRIGKNRSPMPKNLKYSYSRSDSHSSISSPFDRAPLGSPITQRVNISPLRFSFPAPTPTPLSLSTPPSTDSPSPSSIPKLRSPRLPYQRHKPSHLQLKISPYGNRDLNHDRDNNQGLNLTPTHTPHSATTPTDPPLHNPHNPQSNLPANPPPNPPNTTIKPPHRPLSPFTTSGLLRRLSSTSTLRRRPSTPSPLVPTVQEVSEAVDGTGTGTYQWRISGSVASDRGPDEISSEVKGEDEEDNVPTSTSRTVRRICSAGLLNGFLGKNSRNGQGRRVVT